MSIKYQQAVFEAQIDKASVEETRKVTFIVAAEATGKEHRNKFNYNWENWQLDNFNANPIVGYQHNVYGDNMCVAPNPDDVIGKATAGLSTFKGKRAIVADTTFEPADINATAEKVFRKVLWGSLKAVSTGVIPIGKTETQYTKNDRGEVLDYQINFPGQELVEFSVVNIPADPIALRKSLKSHTLSALNFVQRSLPEFSLNDLQQMKIQDVLDLFEKRNSLADLGQLEMDLKVADANFNIYTEQLNKINEKKKWTS